MWAYFKGYLKKTELIKHKDSTIYNVNPYIQQGQVHPQQWEKYCKNMNLTQGDIEKKITFNWLPEFCSFSPIYIVKYKQHNQHQNKKYCEILPMKFAAIIELDYWATQILNINQKYIINFNKYKKQGVASIAHIHGLTISHMFHFGQPLYVFVYLTIQ